MPDLLSRLQEEFKQRLVSYADTISWADFVKKHNFVTAMFWYLGIGFEIELEQKKHDVARRFINRYLPVDGEIIATPKESASSHGSNLSAKTYKTFGSEAFMRPTASRLVSSPARNYATQIIKDHELDTFLQGLKHSIEKLDNLRAGHKPGHLEALLKAMRAATHMLIRFYNKIYIKLNIDEEKFSTSKDPFLQLFDLSAIFLCKFAYDRELALFNADSKKNHLFPQLNFIHIEDEYFLNTGANKLFSLAQGDKRLAELYYSLSILAEKYSILQILLQKARYPQFLLAEEDIQILQLRYSNLRFLASATDLNEVILCFYREISFVAFDIGAEFKLLYKDLAPEIASKVPFFSQVKNLVEIIGKNLDERFYAQTLAEDKNQIARRRVDYEMDLLKHNDPFSIPSDIDFTVKPEILGATVQDPYLENASANTSEIKNLFRPQANLYGAQEASDPTNEESDTDSEQRDRSESEASNQNLEGAYLDIKRLHSLGSEPYHNDAIKFCDRPLSAFAIYRSISGQGFSTPPQIAQHFRSGFLTPQTLPSYCRSGFYSPPSTPSPARFFTAQQPEPTTTSEPDNTKQKFVVSINA